MSSFWNIWFVKKLRKYCAWFGTYKERFVIRGPESLSSIPETPLSDSPGLGTQTRYEAPGDLRVEVVENAMINIGLVRLCPLEWAKVGRGTAK